MNTDVIPPYFFSCTTYMKKYCITSSYNIHLRTSDVDRFIRSFMISWTSVVWSMFNTQFQEFHLQSAKIRPVLHHEGSTLTKFLWYEDDYRWQNRHMPEAVVTYFFSDILFTSLRDERPSSQWNAKPWRGMILYGTELAEDTALCAVDALTKWRTRHISLIREESKNNK